MKNKKITDHFDLEELTFSETAVRNEIDNIPTPEAEQNLILLCENILEPLRVKLDTSIYISSGYRCLELNRLIKSKDNSQHIKGQAADIRANGMTISELFSAIIKSGLPFDQVINEFDRWVHVSFAPNPRWDILLAKKENGKTIYKPYI
jgi:uncharacterized protein YcbK (DUF882 family)